MFCVCGKKCSLFCLFISIWATFQLLLMGVYYSLNSLSLLDSLPLKEHYDSLDAFRSEADRAYRVLALRCYVTAIVYGLFALLSFVCLRLGNKQIAASKHGKEQSKHQ